MNVLLAGGGTGGHLFPMLAIADALAADGATLRFVGAARGPESTAIPQAGYRFDGVDVTSAQSRHPWATVRSVASILRGAAAIRSIVSGADVVVSLGGYVSAPAAVAARRTGTPLLLVEPNGVPGIVNRLAARWAAVAAVAFDAATSRFPDRLRVVRTGNPVRPAIVRAGADRAAVRAEAVAAFDLDPERRTVLVVGGSQGARSLDLALTGALPSLADRADLQLLVSAGAAHADELSAADPGAALIVRVLPFIERMDLALGVADLAVSRAGGSVAELAVCGVPAILVPYPFATEDHQSANARELVAVGAARVIRDADLTAAALAAGILGLVDDGETRGAMAAAMRAWARPDAAADIAGLVREVAAR